MSKGGDEDEKNEVPSLPEFKNRADHVVFNKTLRQLTANLNLLRPKGFTKYMVIGMSDADWKKIKKSCETLKDKEDDGGDAKTQGPRSNHRVIFGVLDDIVAYEKSESGYCKEAHEDLYADMAIWWDTRENRIESKDDAEERARIWRLIEKAIPKDMRKYFPNLTIGDIPGVIQRVLELKSKTSGQEDEETHEKWKSLKFANTGNNQLDWAVFFAEYNELILKFDKIADKPSEGRKMLRIYQHILLKDDRTKMLATQVKLNSPDIESDDLMKKVNDLCKAVFSEDAHNCRLKRWWSKTRKMTRTRYSPGPPPPI